MDFATEKGYIEAVSRGDEQAFESLFLHYFPRIKGFISGILQNEEEAEDISQDIFVSMWQNRDRLKEIENLNAYLYRIAKNTVFRHIERSLLFRDYQEQQTNNASFTSTDNDSIEEELYAKELEFLISVAVEKMPPQRKQIYRMSRVDELSNDEIATQLSISKRTYHSLKTTQRKIRENQSPSKQYNLVHKLLRIAAILIIPLLSIAGSYLYIKQNTYNPELIQCFVPEGENQEVILPDGSTVNINSGSILIYPKKFKGDTRTLYLTGEANFTVKKDKEHPFIVSTSYLKVQALGTKFNVQAYSESDKITTTLENGAVKVDKIAGGEDSFILSPNEQLEYNHKTGVFEKRKINAANYSGWTKGELNFINQPLKEILATIQRKYVVDFVINPRLFTSDLYTIKFRQHADINTIMKVLTMTVSGLAYEIDGNTITIYSLNKKGVK